VLQQVPDSTAPGVKLALAPGSESRVVYPGVEPGQERAVVYRINSAGFRDREHAEPKPAGTCRVLVIGDSVTYGTGIDAADTLAEDIERRFAELVPGASIEVLNCGVPATNTGQQVALLEWRGLAFEPDVVFVCATVVDASGAGAGSEERQLTEDPWELRVVKTLGLTSGVFDDERLAPAQKRAIWVRKRSVLADFLAHHVYRFLYARVQIGNYHRDWAEGSTGVVMIRRALARAKELSDRHGFDLQVGMYPFLTELSDDYPFDAETEVLRGICDGLGVPFHDLLEPLRGQDPARLTAHQHDRHPNGHANRLVGEWLVQRLLPAVRARLGS
jgi:lysophospholipase L1-like esterase